MKANLIIVSTAFSILSGAFCQTVFADEPYLILGEVITCSPQSLSDNWISIRKIRTQSCPYSSTLYNAYVAIEATKDIHVGCDAGETPEGYRKSLPFVYSISCGEKQNNESNMVLFEKVQPDNEGEN